MRRSNVCRTNQIQSSLCSFEDSISGPRDMRGRMMAHVVFHISFRHPPGPNVSNPPLYSRFPSIPLEEAFHSTSHTVCIACLHFSFIHLFLFVCALVTPPRLSYHLPLNLLHSGHSCSSFATNTQTRLCTHVSIRRPFIVVLYTHDGAYLVRVAMDKESNLRLCCFRFSFRRMLVGFDYPLALMDG